MKWQSYPQCDKTIRNREKNNILNKVQFDFIIPIVLN